MSEFRLGTFPSSSVLYIYSLRSSIWFNPPYQRASDVWSLGKRQLLIDSILNGYDIPKLYFHEFYPSQEIDGRKYRYAIVDGKQRMESIFAFINNEFALDKNIEYIADPDVKLGNLTYQGLAREHPDLKTRFDGFVMPIVTIQTGDTELIEDMFSRLNEAVPLNAAEKRNALGGPVPGAIRLLTHHNFFVNKLPFNNQRYRHLDLATKFLYIALRGQIVDTKKGFLDNFVRNQRGHNIDPLISEVERTLDAMSRVFINSDFLLRSVGTVMLYYHVFVDAIRTGWIATLDRADFVRFEEIRVKNREEAEAQDGMPPADYALLEYDRFTQSPNDGIALRFRYSVIRQYIGPAEGRPPLLTAE